MVNLLSTMGMFLDVLFKELLIRHLLAFAEILVSFIRLGIAGDLGQKLFSPTVCLVMAVTKGESKFICLERIQTEWSFSRLTEDLDNRSSVDVFGERRVPGLRSVIDLALDIVRARAAS